MPIFEYVLAALIGVTGAATLPEAGSSSVRTLTAEVISQPVGGTEGLVGQATGGSPGRQAGTGTRGRHHRTRRHRRHRHTKVNETGKKPSKS